jgi:hypothetical protein
MSAENDPSWMSQAIGALGVAVTALSTWAWKHTHKRIDTVEAKVDKYVTMQAFMQHTQTRDERLDRIDAALLKHDGTAAKMFDRLDDAIAKTELRFVLTDKENRVRHEALLEGQTRMLVALEALKK